MSNETRDGGPVQAVKLKARIQIIGDYDEESDTYALCLLADAKEVTASGLKDDDEVIVTLATEHEGAQKPACPTCRDTGETDGALGFNGRGPCPRCDAQKPAGGTMGVGR